MTLLIAALALFVQPAAPAEPPPAGETAPAEGAAPPRDRESRGGESRGGASRGGAVPGLDELLGIEEEGAAEPAEAPLRTPEEEALHRRLTGEHPAQQFEQAAELMNEAAWRIGSSGDVGIGTQRMHEDILRKLDQVIAAAERNQQQNSSSSSSRQQQQQQQPQQGGQQQQQQQQENQQGDGERDNTPSDSTDARLSETIPAAGAAWGALPERVREALLQGINDPFSSIYQQQTEAYYRRLAEDPAP